VDDVQREDSAAINILDSLIYKLSVSFCDEWFHVKHQSCNRTARLVAAVTIGHLLMAGEILNFLSADCASVLPLPARELLDEDCSKALMNHRAHAPQKTCVVSILP
jgi:hypothetical protein